MNDVRLNHAEPRASNSSARQPLQAPREAPHTTPHTARTGVVSVPVALPTRPAPPTPAIGARRGLFTRWRNTLRALLTTPTPAAADPESFIKHARSLALSAFLEGPNPVKVLGLTGPLGGEGTTLLAAATAAALARDTSQQTVLVECNWERPRLHEYFGMRASPGLAEWLRGECDLASIRRQVSENLIVIPAGAAHADEVRLIERLRASGVQSLLAERDGLMILDVPPVLSAAYAPLVAALAEGLMIVTRAGTTPTNAVVETCRALDGLPVRGVLLNGVSRWVPTWAERML